MSLTCADVAYVCKRCRHLHTSPILSCTGRVVWSLFVRPFPRPCRPGAPRKDGPHDWPAQPGTTEGRYRAGCADTRSGRRLHTPLYLPGQAATGKDRRWKLPAWLAAALIETASLSARGVDGNSPARTRNARAQRPRAPRRVQASSGHLARQPALTRVWPRPRPRFRAGLSVSGSRRLLRLAPLGKLGVQRGYSTLRGRWQQVPIDGMGGVDVLVSKEVSQLGYLDATGQHRRRVSVA